MTATAQINLSAELTGLADGLRVLSASFAPVTPIEATSLVALASGANVIAVPNAANAVLIVLPAGNTIPLTIKGVAGDTGVPIGTAGFVFLPLASGTASITINATGAVTVAVDFV